MNHHALALCTALSLAACSDKFASVNRVDGPRVLAITSDPAEALPGERVTFRAWLGGFEAPPQIQWTVCARPEETTVAIPLSSFGQFNSDQGCASAGAVDVQPLGTATEQTYEVPRDVLRNERLLRAAYGNDISLTTLFQVADEVGLPLVFTLEAGPASAPTVRAFKRLLVRSSESLRNHNPPAPKFTWGTHAFALSATDPFTCEPVDGMPVIDARAAELRLNPDADESWIERFDFIDAQGQHVPQIEAAIYFTASTAGSWNFGRARFPDREPLWTAPDTATEVTHWYVARDGRGGTAACTFHTSVR